MLQARLYILAAASIAILAGLVWGGRTLYRAGYDAAVVDRVKDTELIERATRALEITTAQAISSIQVKHVTIRQNLEKELTRDVVYRDCVASDRVFDLTNQALTGQPDTAADRVVPTAESID